MIIARKLIAVTAVVASLFVGQATAAPTDPVVAESIHALNDFCAAHGGRQIDVITAAEADGYLPAGPELTAGMVQSGDMNSVARIKRLGKAVVYVIATAPRDMGKDSPIGAAVADSCTVMVRGQLPGLAEAITAWVGVPGEDGAYLFMETPQGRKGPADLSEEAAEAAAMAGQMRMMRFESSKTATGVTYIAVRPKIADKVAAGATGPLADFLGLCVKDDAAGVDAAAQAGRWMFMPNVTDSDMPWPMNSGDIRVRSTEDDYKLLFTGKAEAQLALTVLHMQTYCAIGQAPPNDTVLMKDAEDWVGVAPVEIDPSGARIYLFTVKGDAHESLGEKWEKALPAKLKAGPVYYVQIQRSHVSGDFALVGIGRVTRSVKL
jgi:hypothetical protein